MKKKSIATAWNKKIHAIIENLLKFKTYDIALNYLQWVEDKFETSKEFQHDDEPAVHLWIKGYQLTQNERDAGFLGNFAKVTVQPKTGHHYTLSIEKQKVALERHPLPKKPKRPLPNTGYPTIRLARKRHFFDNIEEPRALMEELLIDFPKGTIPATKDRLYVQVFSRHGKKKPQIEKFILSIEEVDGRYTLVLTKNSPHSRSVHKIMPTLDTIYSYYY